MAQLVGCRAREKAANGAMQKQGQGKSRPLLLCPKQPHKTACPRKERRMATRLFPSLEVAALREATKYLLRHGGSVPLHIQSISGL